MANKQPHHPKSAFRIARFTLNFAHDQRQPMELCFHSDFIAMADRPLSLHFDDARLHVYDQPPVLTAPEPPGVMVNLGSVDLVPDEITQIEVDQQIAREMESIWKPGSRRVDFVLLAGGVLLIACFVATLQPSFFPPHASPISLSPSLMNYTASIALDATNLCPLIFFNPCRHPTIGETSPIAGKMRTIEQDYPAVRTALVNYISKSMSSHAERRYEASAKSASDTRRYRNIQEWTYAGLRYKDVKKLSERAHVLFLAVRRDWVYISSQAFIKWPLDIGAQLAAAATSMEHVETTSADEMFLSKSTSERIPPSLLPKELPQGITRMLDIYRVHLTQLGFLDTEYEAITQCDADADADAQQAACQLTRESNLTPQEMVTRLERWATSMRWTQHLPTTGSKIVDFPLYLVVMKDILEYLVDVAASVHAANTESRTLVDKLKLIFRPHPTDYATILSNARNTTVSLSHQIHDLATGLQAMGSICRTITAMTRSVDALYDPRNWTVKEDAWGVQMVRIPRPEEHVQELRALGGEVARRGVELNGWYDVWKRDFEGIEEMREGDV
ncbi:hypothetical protein ACHAPU_011277 [Fusarium lateritium]